MNLLGTYLKNELTSDVIAKVLTITTLKYSGLEVLVPTTTTMMLDYHDSLEATVTHMQNIKLASFTTKMFLTAKIFFTT